MRNAAFRLYAWCIRAHLHVVVAGAAIFVATFAHDLGHIHATQFHPDESRWLNRAFYVRALAHPFSSAWEDRYLTRGQPPVGSYITGLGLLAQGRDLTTNLPWDFIHGDETNTWWNTSRGAMPSTADLMAGRRTSAFTGAVTALALFAIVTWLFNLPGGIIAGLTYCVHPLQRNLSSLGVSDSPFACLVALSLLAGVMLAAKPTWPRTALLALLLGLGAGTKLSPILWQPV